MLPPMGQGEMFGGGGDGHLMDRGRGTVEHSAMPQKLSSPKILIMLRLRKDVMHVCTSFFLEA